MSMIDPSAFALPAPLVASVAPGPLTPSDAVTQRFNDMMNAGLPANSVTPTPPAGLPVNGMTSAIERVGLGNRILSGLQSVSSDYSKKWADIKSEVNEMTQHPSAGAMLQVQMEVLQASVLYELVGKGISRSTQNIDALIRMS